MTRSTCTSTSSRRRWPRSSAAGSRASSTRNGRRSSSARSSRRPGFAAEHTHYDLPKPRTSFPVGHLTTGVAFAFPWHRDVWYSAPAQQINWWLPIFPVRDDNAMGFDLASFDRAVPNSSDGFDYYENNASRLHHRDAGDPRAPGPAGSAWTTSPPRSWSSCPRPARSCCSPAPSCTPRSRTRPGGPGSASISGRSTSRDLLAGRGAPLVDVYCTGTAIRDFINVADESSFDEETVVKLFGAPPPTRCWCSARQRRRPLRDLTPWFRVWRLGQESHEGLGVGRCCSR